MSSFRGPKGKVARSLDLAVSQKTQKALDRRTSHLASMVRTARSPLLFTSSSSSKSSVSVSPTTFPKHSSLRLTPKQTVAQVLLVTT